MNRLIRIERHERGPRVFLLGRRVHEYQAGFPLLALSPTASLVASVHVSIGAALVAVWLVVKDWPDLFPATRDQAYWSLWLHRLPRDDQEERTRTTTIDGQWPLGETSPCVCLNVPLPPSSVPRRASWPPLRAARHSTFVLPPSGVRSLA